VRSSNIITVKMANMVTFLSFLMYYYQLHAPSIIPFQKYGEIKHPAMFPTSRTQLPFFALNILRESARIDNSAWEIAILRSWRQNDIVLVRGDHCVREVTLCGVCCYCCRFHQPVALSLYHC